MRNFSISNVFYLKMTRKAVNVLDVMSEIFRNVDDEMLNHSSKMRQNIILR